MQNEKEYEKSMKRKEKMNIHSNQDKSLSHREWFERVRSKDHNRG